MANMYNINELSYTAHENTEWFTRALFGGRLISEGHIRILTGIKGDELLSQIDITSRILQADGKDCAWTPNQIIKLSEKKASVKTYKVNLEQCIDTLEEKRTAYQLTPGANNEALPPELEEATMHLIAIGLSNEIEEMIIAGDPSVDPNDIKGMVPTLLDSPTSMKIKTDKFTKANILQYIEQMYDMLPEEVLQDEDADTLKLFGSYGVRRLIRQALTIAPGEIQVLASAWSIDDTDKKNPRMFYMGVEFVPVKGIKNSLVLIDYNNSIFLTDLTSDLDQMELGQMPKPRQSMIYIKGRLRLGFVVPFEDEAVIASDRVTTTTVVTDEPDFRVVPNSLVFAAAGETKTFTIMTKPGVTPVAGKVVNALGFTVTQGETTEGITTVTVVAAPNDGTAAVRTGEVKVSTTEHTMFVTLNQKMEDILTIIP